MYKGNCMMVQSINSEDMLIPDSAIHWLCVLVQPMNSPHASVSSSIKQRIVPTSQSGCENETMN